MKKQVQRFLLITLAVISSLTIMAQVDILQQARELASNGKHEKAEDLLKAYIGDHPDQLEANLLRANNLAWGHKYDESVQQFKSILDQHHNNIEALNGMGYALAWSGSFNEAIDAFDKVLEINPEYLDAQVGLGHTYIMAGKSTKAQNIFSSLVEKHPENAMYRTWLGIAQYSQYKLNKAKTSLREAMEIKPDNREARVYLEKIRELPPPLEISAWAAWSQVGIEDQFGLRLVQISHRLNQKLTTFLRYDNSLGMDNIDFILADHDVNAISTGAIYNWAKKYATRLEYGLRFFPENVIQHQISAQQTFFLPSSFSVRVGGWLGISDQLDQEYLLFAGGHIPLNERLSIEPSYFYSDNGMNFGQQHRILVAGKYRTPKGYEFIVGGMYGNTDLPDDLNLDDQIAGIFSMIILPVSEHVWIQLGVQYESGVFDESLALLGGARLRLGK